MSTGTSRPPADGDRLLDRVEDLGPLVADMRRVDPAVASHDLAERDQVVGRDGQLAGAGEHRREPEGTVAHRLVEELLHGLELGGVGAVERVAQDAVQQGTEADVAGDIDGDALASRARRSSRRGSSRCACAAVRSRSTARPLSLGGAGRGVLAQDLGRDALADLALGGAVLEQSHVGMRMHVDEPGRDDQAPWRR